jgi:uncharacterized membrane protein
MITLGALYLVAGAMFAAFALLSARDAANPRRHFNALFWGLLATSFLAGDHLGDFGNGLLVLALGLVGGLGLLGQGRPETTSDAERAASAERRGNRLFLPALVIPAFALAGTLLGKKLFVLGVPLLEAKQVTLISLGFGVLVALALAMAWLKPKPLVPLQEGRRIMDQVGWAAVLPQTLAALGAVFTAVGLGDWVGGAVGSWLPEASRLAAVAAYCIGMALFTMALGNAFAAFPVITAAVGLPLVIRLHGGDPAVVAAIGMLAGFCGTLMTPMAANFNIVPAALLELSDRLGVIRAQLPTALMMLAANILLMYFLAFR